jgi:hypothetical protein
MLVRRELNALGRDLAWCAVSHDLGDVCEATGVGFYRKQVFPALGHYVEVCVEYRGALTAGPN